MNKSKLRRVEKSVMNLILYRRKGTKTTTLFQIVEGGEDITRLLPGGNHEYLVAYRVIDAHFEPTRQLHVEPTHCFYGANATFEQVMVRRTEVVEHYSDALKSTGSKKSKKRKVKS